MRKIISGITGLMCMLLVLFGLITCMCETPDLDKQLTTLLMGVSIMLVGAGFGFISKEVSNG
jgi:hypothetical protein